MYAHVRLLNGFAKPLIYKIPSSWPQEDITGSLITVPLKNQHVPALVIGMQNKPSAAMKFAIREAISIEPFPHDEAYAPFITHAAAQHCVEPLAFYQRIKSFIASEQEEVTCETMHSEDEKTIVTLTQEQARVVDYTTPRIGAGAYSPILLHGVTGSGKTEIYKKLLLDALSKNSSAIFLLPEVSLCIKFEHLFKMTMPENTPIFGFHSASRPKEKRELWNRLLAGTPTIIIGVHLPILVPITRLGLIVVDEEHDTNYQEKRAPQFHTREAAIMRAKITHIPIMLGSATPSISSLYKVKHEPGWKFFQLKQRFSGAFPSIELSYFSTLRKGAHNFWITLPLKQAIAQTLQKGEQVLIYLNRRGYSFFVKCPKCDFIEQCPHCSVSLTLHKESESMLHCHYCPYSKTMPTHCPSCKTPENEFLKKGIGTQQAVMLLEKLFPEARIYRADLDTTKKKREWHNTLLDFEAGKGDILVGTQTITKGYHFPNVTLVGILWADLGLNFPSFDATETTLQKLIQVAGRAGRSKKSSRVIVQALTRHAIFDYIDETKYLSFYKSEIEQRSLTNYPPLCTLIRIEARNSNPMILEQDCEKLTARLEEKAGEVSVFGPIKPALHKLQKIEIRHIFLKAASSDEAYALLNSVDLKNYKSSISITPHY